MSQAISIDTTLDDGFAIRDVAGNILPKLPATPPLDATGMREKPDVYELTGSRVDRARQALAIAIQQLDSVDQHAVGDRSADAVYRAYARASDLLAQLNGAVEEDAEEWEDRVDRRSWQPRYARAA